jgi:hypothetical protein
MATLSCLSRSKAIWSGERLVIEPSVSTVRTGS